jgi:hypothetical protein
MNKPEHVKTPHGSMLMFPAVQQGSEEWHALRVGRVTASEAAKIVTPAKCELSKQATDYMYRLIADTIDTDVKGQPPIFPSYWMTRGTELEPLAREAFRKESGKTITEVGFCVRKDEWEILGCSPDFLTMDPVSLDYEEGGEIKCLQPSGPDAIVDGGVVPADFLPQIRMGLAVTGLRAWNFVSYCPGMQLFHRRVERDALVDKTAAALDQFLVDYGVMRARLLPLLRIQS